METTLTDIPASVDAPTLERELAHAIGAWCLETATARVEAVGAGLRVSISGVDNRTAEALLRVARSAAGACEQLGATAGA